MFSDSPERLLLPLTRKAISGLPKVLFHQSRVESGKLTLWEETKSNNSEFLHSLTPCQWGRMSGVQSASLLHPALRVPG